MILILTTLEQEATGLANTSRGTREGAVAIAPRVNLAVLGTVGQQAAPATRTLLEIHKPDAVVSLSFAGALDDTLREGDLVLGSRTVSRDGEGNYSSWIPSDETLLRKAREALHRQDIPYHEGDVITALKVIGTPSEKGRLGATSGGQVVDMEGRWIAGAAQEKGVPLLLVRAVLDRTSFGVPGPIARLAGLPKWAQGIGVGLACLVTPWNIPPLLRLKRCSEVAAESLARFVQAFLSEAHTGDPQGTGSPTIAGDNG